MDIFFGKLLPDTLRYVQWTIPSLLYQTRRKNPLVYKGLTVPIVICIKISCDDTNVFQLYTLPSYQSKHWRSTHYAG